MTFMSQEIDSVISHYAAKRWVLNKVGPHGMEEGWIAMELPENTDDRMPRCAEHVQGHLQVLGGSRNSVTVQVSRWVQEGKVYKLVTSQQGYFSVRMLEKD